MEILEIDFTKKKDLIRKVLAEQAKISDFNWKWTIRNISKHTISINWSYLDYLHESSMYFKLGYMSKVGRNTVQHHLYVSIAKGNELIDYIEIKDWISDKKIKSYLEDIISKMMQYAFVTY